MAVTVKNRRGKQVTLLNPAEKGKKYANELRTGVKQTNAGVQKKNKNGGLIKLSKSERAYRGGYLDARAHNAKAYKASAAKKQASWEKSIMEQRKIEAPFTARQWVHDDLDLLKDGRLYCRADKTYWNSPVDYIRSEFARHDIPMTEEVPAYALAAARQKGWKG